jgi:hydroxyquinol 1,2-dioxygenase
MQPFAETQLTEAVLARLAGCKDERMKQVMASLIGHLHQFVRDVKLTEKEWSQGIEYLTATGKMCDEKRQEYVLLSDVLGVSMLVDTIHHANPGGATESTVLGPFFVHGAPEVPHGGDISAGLAGEPTWISGRVLDTQGAPIADASLDVWLVRPDAKYDVQDPGAGMQLRGRLRTDAQGRYAVRALKPVSYPVPTGGPVGRVLDHMGRHPMRPAHVHFIVTAPGYEQLVTHLFARGDAYLDSDVVFGVKDSLVVAFEPMSDAQAEAVGMPKGSLHVDFDFHLAAVDPTRKGRAALPAVEASADPS